MSLSECCCVFCEKCLPSIICIYIYQNKSYFFMCECGI